MTKTFALLVGLLVGAITSALADPPLCPDPEPCQGQAHCDDTAPITVNIAKWVCITFDTDDAFALCVEAGQHGAAATKAFTARHNCPASVTGEITPPPTAPAGMTWDWNFVGDGQQLSLPGAGIYTGGVQVSVADVGFNHPAGLYSGGTMKIKIDALP